MVPTGVSAKPSHFSRDESRPWRQLLGGALDVGPASPFKLEPEYLRIDRGRSIGHRPEVRSAWIASVFVLGLAFGPVTASAQPTVTVRAESRLELDVRRADDGLIVSGALRDDLGVPLAGDEVSLELSHAVASEHQRGSHVITRVISAAADGTFSTRFQVALGDYVVDATYEGAAEHLGTRATRFFDLDRAHLTLRLSLDDGTRVDLGIPQHTLTIAASSEAGGQGLTMIVSDESAGAELARGETDASGTLRLTIDSGRLGPPAAGRIIVRTHGDATRAEAQSELPIVRFRATETTLTLSRASLGPDETLAADGLLTDGVAPLEREAISLITGDLVLGTVLTDDHGRFHAVLDHGAFGDLEGPLTLVARFDGSAPWIPASESAPLPLEIRRPIALGWLWAILPIALAAIAVRWSLQRDPGTLPVPRRREGLPGVAFGARRTLVAQRMDLSGVVRDAISNEPIAGARVSGAGVDTLTDAQGAFSTTATRELTTLVVDHAEYVAVDAAITLPHRGEHEGMQFRLVSRRALSFAALRQVAVDLSPDGEVALALTQREIFELLRARGASPPALPDLVARVEIACYAALPPDDAQIGEIRRSAAAVVARPARPPGVEAERGRR